MTPIPAILLLFILIPLTGFSQSELNQVDSAGNKQGQWIEYLDGKFKVLKDSTGATWWAYNYYDHGANNYRISFGKEWKQNDSLYHTSADTTHLPGIQALDGEYKWYDKKKHLVSEDRFSKGVHLWSKVYDDDMLVVHYDYTQTYLGNPLTYLIEIFEEEGMPIQYYWRKGIDGWKAYPLF